MKLNNEHYTQEFLDHLDYIIEHLREFDTPHSYIETEWFDETVIINLTNTLEMRNTIYEKLNNWWIKRRHTDLHKII